MNSRGTLAVTITACQVLMLSVVVGNLSQAQQLPSATAARATTSPLIDGRLDEATWDGEDGITALVQREPLEGRVASERTVVKLRYDGAALYVGAWMYDRNPAAIVTGQTLRDASLSDSDAILLVLDTYPTARSDSYSGRHRRGSSTTARLPTKGRAVAPFSSGSRPGRPPAST
jgi:hypothetical protein